MTMGSRNYIVALLLIIVLLITAKLSHSWLPTIAYWLSCVYVYAARTRYLGHGFALVVATAVIIIVAPILCAHFWPEAYLYVADGRDGYVASNAEVNVVRVLYYGSLAWQAVYSLGLAVARPIDRSLRLDGKSARNLF